MDEMSLKRLEIGMKAGVLEYLNIFDKELFIPTGPYFQLVVDPKNDWYFDTIDNPNSTRGYKGWSIGFGQGYEFYIDLYAYDPWGDHDTFDDSKWNDESFALLTRYFKADNKLNALFDSIRRFELSFRDTEYDITPEQQKGLGRFWPWEK